jgi:hypothetical protein
MKLVIEQEFKEKYKIIHIVGIVVGADLCSTDKDKYEVTISYKDSLSCERAIVVRDSADLRLNSYFTHIKLGDVVEFIKVTCKDITFYEYIEKIGSVNVEVIK